MKHMKYAVVIAYHQHASARKNYILSEHTSKEEAVESAIDHVIDKNPDDIEIDSYNWKENSYVYNTGDYDIQVLDAKDFFDETFKGVELDLCPSGYWEILEANASDTSQRKAVFRINS